MSQYRRPAPAYNDEYSHISSIGFQDDDSRSNLYPPNSQEDPFHAPVGQAGGGAYGTSEKIVRDRNNPYAQNYRGEGGRGWIKWVAVVLALLVCVGVGVGVGVWRSHVKSNKSSGAGGNSGTSLQYINGTARVVKSDPMDPSNFEKDPKLHQSFYGIAYTPFLAQDPWCGATLANVTEDIQLLSQLTTRIRMCVPVQCERRSSLTLCLIERYGTACNQTQMVLQAIQDTKVNMSIWIGAYIGSDTTVNAQQQTDALDALKAYGADHVSGVIIGNEYLLDSTDVATATTLLVTQMTNFRTELKALSLSKTLPVGTADAGSKISLAIAEGSDFFMVRRFPLENQSFPDEHISPIQANVHPYFGGLAIDDAAAWTGSYFTETDVLICKQATNSPTCYIAETVTYEGATAGVPELQTFLDTFICQANANGTAYLKDQFGTVEPYWGLGDSNKVWKNITFPSC
ncbi:hypothetical protein P7C70_g7931, partial [Phenoliferia sp. Uapishka_3]